MKRLLITWSDRGIDGPAPAHQSKRPGTDRGPVLRLLEEGESRDRYQRVLVLSVPGGLGRAHDLARDIAPHVSDVEVRRVELHDPSDYKALFAELAPFAAEIEGAHPSSRWEVDVLLSAGTPQAQTIWVILVQASMLRARLLQVIPAAFVPKPHPKAIREVSLDIEGFPEIRVLREEVARLRAETRVRTARIVAGSEAMRELMARVVRVAPSDLPVLVFGETGTGKEVVARAIHDGSRRSSGPLVAENCGALAESVLASELFGHEAHAFTGANSRHRGLFEQAHGGTMFLDEVGELPLAVQAMLLRVLEDGTLRRVGGEKSIKVDVRVVAATHRDLENMVQMGTFREDLYYRLRGATLRVPPLRERVSDIPQLVRGFLHEVSVGRRARPFDVPPEVMRQLALYRWPGNVRELRSEVHRWRVFCDHQVGHGDLAPEIRAATGVAQPGHVPGSRPRGEDARATPAGETVVAPLEEIVRAAEREAIEAALRATSNNLLRAAKALGIERNTLKRKLRAWGAYPVGAKRARPKPVSHRQSPR